MYWVVCSYLSYLQFFNISIFNNSNSIKTMCCSKCYISGKNDFIHTMTYDMILKHLPKFARVSKVTMSSTRFYQPINLTIECLNQWQNTVVLRHLTHVIILEDKQLLSGGQSVSQSDRLFAITLSKRMTWNIISIYMILEIETGYFYFIDSCYDIVLL